MLGRLAYSKFKDPFSAASHGAGAILAVIGAIALIIVTRGKAVALAASLVYAGGLVFVYSASAIYHARATSSPWPQRLDHMAIYVMIAGTYTPVCLLNLPFRYGIPMLAAEWTLAAIGLILNIFFGGGHNVLRVVLYLAMGWMATLALGPLRQHLSAHEMQWLLAGGVVYTVGTVIYATERPKLWPGKFDAHDLWHVFVLAASGFHYALVMSMAVRA